MALIPAGRMQTLPVNFFARLEGMIKDLQAQDRQAIRLDIGSPDLPPPPHVIQALSQTAARADSHGYQPHSGGPALRKAWTELYRREYETILDPETEVCPLIGSKEGIFHLMLALVQPGDVVLVPDPAYMTYDRAARFAGAEVYPMKLAPENDYLPDLEAIPAEVAARTRVMWLNYPNNPTAAVADLSFFEQVARYAKRHQITLLHDAAYGMLTFNEQNHPSLLQVWDREQPIVEFNTLSKSHHMAGWRLGAALGSPEVLRLLSALKTNVDSGHFLPIQTAAIAAMTGDQSFLAGRRTEMRQRRDLFLTALQAVGLQPAIPSASLYIWCPAPAGWPVDDFIEAVLQESAVSFTPGTVFGPGGDGYFRISLTAPQEQLSEAAARLYDAWPRIQSRRHV